MLIRILPILLIVIVGVGIVLWARWANALAVLDVDEGKIREVRGDLSAGQRRDVQEAVHLAGVRNGRIRFGVKRGGVTVRVQPANEGLEQRLRNIAGTWRL